MLIQIKSILIALLLILLSHATSWAADGGDMQTATLADGSRLDAYLSSVNSDGSFRFTTADGKARTVPPEQLVRWGAAVDTKKGPQILLVDGSLLVAYPLGEPVSLVDDSLRAELDLFDLGTPRQREVKLPVDAVRGVLFQVPGNLGERDRMLDRLADLTRRSDLVWLANGDTIEGTLVSLNEKSVKLKMNGTETAIDMGRVAAVSLNPALARRPGTQSKKTILSTADGSRLMVEKLTSAKDVVRVELDGVKSIPVSPEKIVGIQSLGGHVTYLSDLKSHSYLHLPLLEMKWPYHNDRSVAGGRLRSLQGVHHKGLGMHSTARLTYRLDKPYRRLEAELAIDREAAGGSVVFRVMVDEGGSGKKRWKVAYTSPVVRSGDSLVPMFVDISKAKRISLVVDFAERGDVQDHANWIDARLVR